MLLTHNFFSTVKPMSFARRHGYTPLATELLGGGTPELLDLIVVIDPKAGMESTCKSAVLLQSH